MTHATASAFADALRNRYRLERELGQGGMATVYLAHDLKHDRAVALKVLRPELAAVVGAERFLREIQFTAKLQHPHIVTLIDSGEAARTLYYVLPFIEGESLRQRLTREGQLPLGDVVRITQVVASALQYAHDQGVIHRDIKPENILFSRGEAVVADFGIALAAASAGRERLTETGLSLGTPAYMSPEQASGDPRLDGRSDQYSLACVVYEMLAGEPPYTGSTPQAIMAKRLSEPIPKVTTLRPVPGSVEVAVTRALARTPADRYSTVTDFAAALTRRATLPRRFPTKRTATLLAGLTVVATIALLAWMLRRPLPPRSMVTRQLTFTGNAGGPAISPDGKWIAYVSGDTALMVQELSGGPPLLVARRMSSFSSRYPAWSPDGATLFFAGQPDSASPFALYSIPRLGGTPREVAAIGRATIFSLRGDARALVQTGFFSDTLRITELPSGQLASRFALSPHSYTAWRIPFSPDGRWIAFGGFRGGVPFLGVVSSDGTIFRRLVDWVDRGAVRWAPSGDAIYFQRRVVGGSDLMKVRIDRRSGARLSDPTRVMSHAPFSEFDVAADGQTLAYQKENPVSQIWTLTIEGPAGRTRVSTRQLTSRTNQVGTPDISPDGQLVAFAQDDESERNLYVTAFTGGPSRLLGTTRSDYFTPRWSPDGKRLAFAAGDSSAPGVMVADASGRRAQPVGHSPIGLFLGAAVWSPDGMTLVYPSDDGRRYKVLDLQQDHESDLVPPDSVGWLHSALFSPDGHSLVATGVGPSGGTSLWRVSLTERRWERLEVSVPGLWRPLLWADDGWIYYYATKGQIRRLRPDGGVAEPYAKLPIACDWSELSMARDARRLVCTVTESRSDIWIATDFDPEAN